MRFSSLSFFQPSMASSEKEVSNTSALKNLEKSDPAQIQKAQTDALLLANMGVLQATSLLSRVVHLKRDWLQQKQVP